MKQFDLEKALENTPVKLRNGWKAYVKYVMPEEYEGSYPLRGFCIKRDNDICELCWTMEGTDTADSITSDLDIIGMWEEPRPRVQLDLPAPLKEQQEDMWFIAGDGVAKSDAFSSTLLKTGKYFASEKDAEEWLNAMKAARK